MPPLYAQKAIVHNAHCAYHFKVQSCDCINFVRAIDRKDSEKRQFNWSAIKVASALLVIGVGAAVGALGGDFKIKLPNKK